MHPITTQELDLIAFLFSQITSVSAKDMDEVSAYLKKASYSKNETILDIGQRETRIRFISKGIAHLYTYIDGEVFTINIAIAGMLVNSLESYISNRPSNDRQVAISDLEVLYLEKRDIEKLMHNNNTFCYIYAKLFESVLNEREQRTLLLQYKSASKRFEYFLKTIVNAQRYLQEVPHKLVAQYLGLAPETYCRIKNQYLKSNHPGL